MDLVDGESDHEVGEQDGDEDDEHGEEEDGEGGVRHVEAAGPRFNSLRIFLKGPNCCSHFLLFMFVL